MMSFNFGVWKKKPVSAPRLFGVQIMSIVLLVMFIAPPAYSTDLTQSHASEAKELILTPVLKLHQDTSRRLEKIRGGRKANTDDFPASFQIKTGKDTCTWFLVGDRTLMTAAHCVPPDGVSIKVEGWDQKKQKTVVIKKCTRAPNYSSDPSQDWALCLLKEPYKLPQFPDRPTGYEVLNTDAKMLKMKQTVVITGFGCSHESGSSDNIYRYGLARITNLPPSVRVHNEGKRPNFVELREKPASLCAGDSGGPAFQTVDGTLGYRLVVGINAKTEYMLGYSYLASTSTRAALDFFRNWARVNKQRICGLDEDARNCRPTRY